MFLQTTNEECDWFELDLGVNTNLKRNYIRWNTLYKVNIDSWPSLLFKTTLKTYEMLNEQKFNTMLWQLRIWRLTSVSVN